MAKSKGTKLAIAIVVVTLVVVWLIAFGGIGFLQSLVIAPGAPAGVFDIEGANVVVTGGSTTVVEAQHKATIHGTNADLAGVTSVAFKLSVRDISPSSVPRGFTMTITAGTYQSAGGGNFPLVPNKGSTSCYDMSLGAAGGGSMVLTCNTIHGSITDVGGQVSATLTSTINGALWGTGAPPGGTVVSIIFHIDGQTDYQLAFQTGG